MEKKMSYLFVSGWKREPGKGGIIQYSFDTKTGELKPLQTLFEDVSFSMSYLDKENNILFALNETPDLQGRRFGGGGTVYALHLDRETGKVKKTEVVPLHCACPAYISISDDRQYMLAVGHGAKGYVTKLIRDSFGDYHAVVISDDTPVLLLSRTENGGVGRILDAVMHTGCGPTPKQTSAHPHTVVPSPSGKLYAVCDKGDDHIYMYGIDKERNKLVRCAEPAAVPPGTAPRYCVFHPTLPFFYHNAENTTQVFVHRYDESGTLTPVGSVDSLVDSGASKNFRMVEGQGFCIHPSGRFLYNVVHGPNLVAVFQIDPNDGSLQLLQNQPVDFDWPRGAALSPDGKFLIVTCVRGKKVLCYRVNEDGTLAPTEFACDQENAAYATFWDAQ